MVANGEIIGLNCWFNSVCVGGVDRPKRRTRREGKEEERRKKKGGRALSRDLSSLAKPTGPALSSLEKPTRAPRTSGSASTWPSHLSSSTWTTGSCRHRRGRVAPIGFGVDDWILFLKKIKRACYFQNLIIFAYYLKKLATLWTKSI